MADTVVFPKLGIQFNIDPVAFSIGSFPIYWYAIFIVTGVFLGVFYALRRAKSFGLDPDHMLDVIMVGFIGAIVCARGFYVVFKLDTYDNLWDMINTRDGGLAIYGGIIGAVVFGGIMAKLRKLKFTPLLDLAGIGFLIGQSLGRWGNFFNREAFGTNTDLPWGMTSNTIESYLTHHMTEISDNMGIVVDPSATVHPCFLYESIWCLIGIFVLHALSKRRHFDGEIFLMYIGWYGLGRFVIEGLRTDSLMLGQIKVSQLIAGICVIASMLSILIIRSNIKRSGEYVFYKDTEQSKLQLEQYELSRLPKKKLAEIENAQAQTASTAAEAEVASKPESETNPQDDAVFEDSTIDNVEQTAENTASQANDDSFLSDESSANKRENEIAEDKNGNTN